MNTTGSQINQAFIDLLNQGEDGRKQAEEVGGVYTRDKLREVSFWRKVIPPERVTKADCQRSLEQDTLIKIIDIEPQSRAMPMDFRSEPDSREVYAERYPVAFHTIFSEQYEKYEQELLAYEMPITKIIEDHTVKDIQEVEDLQGLLHSDSAIEAIQQEANGGVVAFNASNFLAGTVVSSSKVKGALSLTPGPDDFTVHPCQRPDLIELFKMFSSNRLRCEVLLMTEPDFDDLLSWTSEDFGDKIQSETVVDGYKYNTLLGRKFIRTIKTDILRVGKIYGFTSPEFLGKFFILNDTKFWADKEKNLIMWASWEDIGGAIGNIRALGLLELFRGSTTPGAEDVGYEARVPMAVEDLGGVNNMAASGLTFPRPDVY